MQTIRVQTTQNVFINYPLASIGDRILAFLIDQLILVLYTFAIIILFQELKIENEWIWILTLGFPWLFYALLFETIMNGQTPGKRIFKIQVIRLDGTSPALRDYLLRWIFTFVDFYVMSGVIAIITICTSDQGQRLGDVVAGTSVIKLQKQENISADMIFVMPEEEYTPSFTQVSTLSPRDIEIIQQVLEVNRTYGNTRPLMLATQKIQSLLNIETDLPPVKFLYTVVKDYQFITSQKA